MHIIEKLPTFVLNRLSWLSYFFWAYGQRLEIFLPLQVSLTSRLSNPCMTLQRVVVMYLNGPISPSLIEHWRKPGKGFTRFQISQSPGAVPRERKGHRKGTRLKLPRTVKFSTKTLSSFRSSLWREIINNKLKHNIFLLLSSLVWQQWLPGGGRVVGNFNGARTRGPGAHHLEYAAIPWSCHSVFTDQSILSLNYRQFKPV